MNELGQLLRDNEIAEKAVEDVVDERKRQRTLRFDGQLADVFDRNNTRNDWVAYVSAYNGRASDVNRNRGDDTNFRDMMVKVGALALAAIESYDKGYC